MTALGYKFRKCPTCGKRSVYLHLGREDYYACRTKVDRYSNCPFYFYTGSTSALDEQNRALLNAANPDRQAV